MKEILFALFLLLIAILVFALTCMFPTDIGEIGPAFFPRILAIILAVLSSVWLLESILKRRNDSNEKTEEYNCENDQKSVSFKEKPLFKMFVVFLMVVIYAIGLWFFGYLLWTFLFLVAMVSFMMPLLNLKKFITKVIPIAIIITLITFAVFRLMIRIPLPEGSLFV